MRPDGTKVQVTINAAVAMESKMWPTPRAGETSDQTSVPGHFFGLSSAVKRGWPTPRAADGNLMGGAGANHSPTLVSAVRVQGSARPTPAARDYKDTGTSPAEFDRNTPGLAACAGGSLSPAWVERLMGFPDDWTSPLTDGPSAPAKRSPKASPRASRRSGSNDGNG